MHKTTKSLAAKNALPRLMEAVAAMVKEPDSPTGRIREERFRNVLEEIFDLDLCQVTSNVICGIGILCGNCEEVASQVLDPDEIHVCCLIGPSVGAREKRLSQMQTKAIFPEKSI